jgi:hypothetical protein
MLDSGELSRLPPVERKIERAYFRDEVIGLLRKQREADATLAACFLGSAEISEAIRVRSDPR